MTAYIDCIPVLGAPHLREKPLKIVDPEQTVESELLKVSIHHVDESWGGETYALNANAAWDFRYFLTINPKNNWFCVSPFVKHAQTPPCLLTLSTHKKMCSFSVLKPHGKVRPTYYFAEPPASLILRTLTCCPCSNSQNMGYSDHCKKKQKTRASHLWCKGCLRVKFEQHHEIWSKQCKCLLCWNNIQLLLLPISSSYSSNPVQRCFHFWRANKIVMFPQLHFVSPLDCAGFLPLFLPRRLSSSVCAFSFVGRSFQIFRCLVRANDWKKDVSCFQCVWRFGIPLGHETCHCHKNRPELAFLVVFIVSSQKSELAIFLFARHPSKTTHKTCRRRFAFEL